MMENPEYQRLLFPYAYNILGSAEDARDAIQEVMYRYTSKGINPDNEKNYLIRGVINESINQKKKNSRQVTPENWLPEPVETDAGRELELKEVASYSVLILLEKLTPKERAVFILKEAFAYTHPEIAEVLGITEESSRKLLSRAGKKVGEPAPSKVKSSADFQLLEKFVQAIRSKDLDKLHRLFTSDITLVADGGDKVRVVKKFCYGFDEVSELVIFAFHTFQTKSLVKPVIINHQPALMYYHRQKVVGCQVFHVDEDGRIDHISVMVDPAKLRLLKP